MGLFRKIREIDKAVDNFVDGMIGNAVNTAVNFANRKTYTVDITANNNVVGTLEFTTSDPDYAMQKINNYLSSGVSSSMSLSDIVAWYRVLDNLNIGASRQILRLDEMKLRRIFNDVQVRDAALEKEYSGWDNDDEESASTNGVAKDIGRTDFWDSINIGDCVEEAVAKAKSGAKEVEPGLFQLNGYSFRFDTRNFIVIDGKVEGLTAVKYFSSSQSAQTIKDEMNLMLSFVRKNIFNNILMSKVEEYEQGTDLTGDKYFVDAIRVGDLTYGYWPEDGSLSPSFQLVYDEDTPDKLLAMATALSQQAVDSMG